MAGIAGYLALEPIPLDDGAAILSRMLDALAERGGGARGTAAGPDCGIAMRADDQVSGPSPYRSPRGDFLCAVDGRPSTQTSRDLSVPDERGLGESLRDLYETLEEDFVRQIRGAFAVALFHGRTRRLVLARDAFGQKPLFIAWSRRRRMLLFASEAKAVLQSRQVESRFDGRAVLDVLAVGHPLGGRTLFAGIESLPAGSWMSLDVRGRELRVRWFTPPYPLRGGTRPRRRVGAGDVQDRLRNIVESVSSPSDGCVTWGGVEGALLVALRGDSQPGLRVYTPSWVTSEGWDGGSAFWGDLSERVGAEQAEVALVHPDQAAWLRVLRALERPFLDPRPLFEAQVYAGMAADARTQVLGAEGASSIFRGCGLSRGKMPRWRRLLRSGLSPFRFWGSAGLAGALRRGWRYERGYEKAWGAILPEVAQWSLTAHVSNQLFAHHRTLPPGRSRLAGPLPGPPLLVQDALHRALRLHQQVLLEAELWHSGQLAGWAGLRLQVPYLDAELVRWTAELAPGELLGGPALNLLRRAVPSRIGGRVRRRRARPLGSPYANWPFGPAVSPWVRDVLLNPSSDGIGLFEGNEVRAMLSRVCSMRPEASVRTECRVLLGVLGLKLIARSFGVTDIEGWTDAPR